MQSNTATETLTDTLLALLRVEAGANGDAEMVDICDGALDNKAEARAECATVITTARAMDDETPFVRVVA